MASIPNMYIVRYLQECHDAKTRFKMPCCAKNTDSPFHHPVLEFAISSTRISVAPAAVNSSMTVAICFFSTIALTAAQSGVSNAVTVGARLPGVIRVPIWRSARGMLY